MSNESKRTSEKAEIPSPNPYITSEILEEAEHKEELFKVDESITLYTQRWFPKNSKMKAIIIRVHGYCDHSSRFAKHVLPLIKNGFGVCALDLEGHGYSDGIRGYVPNLHRFANHVLQFTEYVSKNFKSESGKIFLFGESMGGAISIISGLKKPHLFSGAILHAPLIIPASDSTPPWIVIQVLKVLAFLFPTFPAVAANRGKNCTDPKKEMEFLEDPNTYSGKMRIGTGLAFLKGCEYIQNHVEQFNLPFIVQYGTNDRACDSSGSKLLFEKAISNDKTKKEYENMAHALMEEENKHLVEQDYIDWLNKRVASIE